MLWWVLAASAVCLGACGLLFWRGQRRSENAMTKGQETEQHADTAAFCVAALEQELLQLEIDRSLGNISGEEYGVARQALEGTVKRALTRAGAA